MVTRGLQHGAGCIIEHGSHMAARGDAVRRAFSYDGKIIGCRINYVICLIVKNGYQRFSMVQNVSSNMDLIERLGVIQSDVHSHMMVELSAVESTIWINALSVLPSNSRFILGDIGLHFGMGRLID
ncbi:hypothetical protein YC2023_006987 [Brassica napus]